MYLESIVDDHSDALEETWWSKLRKRLRKMKKSNSEVVVENKIIKKQTEVWVYNDEVYATYEKACYAKLAESIRTPLLEGYYKRQGYGASDIRRMVQSSVNKTGQTVYLDDVINLLPTLVKNVN